MAAELSEVAAGLRKVPAHEIKISAPYEPTDDEPIELIPCLFIGSLKAANNHTALQEKGITHVLTLSGKDVPSKLTGVQYTEVPLSDSLEEKIEEVFSKCFAFIDTAISSGGSVLVHCLQGISRSGTVCIGYIMSKTKLPFLTVWRQVRERRSLINPNENFQARLIQYAKTLGVEEATIEVEEAEEIASPLALFPPKIKTKRESRLSVIVSAPPTITKVVRDKTPAFKWNGERSQWQEARFGKEDDEETEEEAEEEAEEEEESEIAVDGEEDDKAKDKKKEKEKKGINFASLPPLERSTLRVLTYNVWYADRHLWPRFRAFSEILRTSDADIICLQEVRADVVKRLLSFAWVREGYLVSDSAGFTLGQYGVFILSRLPVVRFVWYPLPSQQASRFLLRADFNFNGKSVSVMNTQLESGIENAEVRKEQLVIAQGALTGAETTVLVGDFNLYPAKGESTDESTALAKVLSDHKDVWPLLHPLDKGFTYDSTRNTVIYEKEQARFDRILLKTPTSGGWTAKSIKLVGDESIPLSSGESLSPKSGAAIFASPHFGLLAEFSIPAK